MRTSPIHYIAPSAISITPNANNSPSDLAIHVARGTKIKVCYPPIAELGYNDANYKEWTLRGRNRRLADATVPYTIYARLNKGDQADGYLVFAQKVHDEKTDEWNDPYILSPNVSQTSSVRLEGADGNKYLWPPITKRQAEGGRSGFWWIKIGDVSLPDASGNRTVTLDTGILGTDQYNRDWYLDSDKLPVKPVRVVYVERGDWTDSPKVEYTGVSGTATPDGTLEDAEAVRLGWVGNEPLTFENGEMIDEPYHYEHLTRNRWLSYRLSEYFAGMADQDLYELLTQPSRGWEEENWVETSRVWKDGRLWECTAEGTAEEPADGSNDWKMLLQGGADGDGAYNVELTKSSDSATIDPSGNVVGGYRTVSKDSQQNEFYTYRFHTSVTVMKGGEYLHLCGALDDEEQLGEGNFTVEAIGAGCDLKMEGTTCYITGIWHCNDGDSSTPNTSYNKTSDEYQLMRAMNEAVAHITLNIEGKTSVTKDYRLQLVHLPTDTVIVQSHNEIAAANWSTKRNNWTNQDDIVIPLTASSGGQPVMFQTKNGDTAPDVRLAEQPGWLGNYSVDWADYDEDGDGHAEYTAAQHMAVELTIPIASIRRTWVEKGIGKSIANSNLLKINVTTVVDGVEYENIVPFTLNVTTDKAIYVLAPSVRQVTGTMIGGTWDPQTKAVSNARYRYTAAGQECSVVKCSLMSYDENNAMTEITSAADIHDDLTFLLNGQPSSLAAFRAGLANAAVAGKNHTLYDELSEIVFAIRLDGKDYESEGVPILRNGAQLSIGTNGNWYIGGVDTEVFAKGTEVISTKIYYTDPMDGSTPPVYAPTDSQRGKPVSPYLKTECPAAVEGKFIHYVSITIFSDSEETYVYNYGTIGTGNTITVIHDRDYYASHTELSQAQLKAVAEASWSESTPADYSAYNRYLYARDTARYYRNGTQQTATIGGIAYPRIVYTLLSYWGQDGSGVEFIYYLGTTNHTTGQTPAPSTPASSGNGKVNGKVTPYAVHIDDWVPDGWTDNPQGIDYDHQVEWVSQRTSRSVSNGTVQGGHEWSAFSEPKVWSKWGQNGMDGDGVEYVFMRTSKNVAPQISTSQTGYDADEFLPAISNQAASGAESQTCTDDPKGVSRDFPYEWVAKRTKAAPNAETGKRSWEKYTGEMKLWSTYASLRLDIDNEMDTVPTDSTGKIIADRTVETVVHLYDGASEVDISAASLSISNAPASTIATQTAAALGKAKKLSWTFKADQPMADAYAITIGYTYNGVPYSAALTVTASKGQAVMQLKPSQSSVVFKRQSDNTLSSPDDTLKLDIIKLDKTSTDTKAATQDNLTAWGITVRYDKQSMPGSKTDGTAWPSGNSITIASSDKEICIALFDTASGKLLDRETVPVIEDGKHGENSVRIDLDNENDSMLYDGKGQLVSDAVTSTAYMFDGADDVSAKATWAVSAAGCTLASAATSRNIRVTGMSTTTAKVTVQGTYTDAHGNTHSKTASLKLKKITDGDKYSLVITPNAIAYNKTKDLPDESTIAIQLWRTSVNSGGGVTRQLSEPPSGYKVFANGQALQASATGTYSYTTDNSAISEVQVRVSTTATSNDALDAETIPVNKAEDGQASFVSHVFKRQNTNPGAPTGGNYSSPVPEGWRDGVPDGTEQVWMSTRIFTSDGKPPQQDAWTNPRAMTDTADFDVEFSSAASPGNPVGHPNTNTQWSNTAGAATIWMATSECHNGVWSDWQVVKVKGEKGESSVRLGIDNGMDTVPTDSTGKIIAARTVETVVHLYDGASEVDISGVALSISGAPGTAIATQTAAALGKAKKLSWTFIAGETMADAYAITIGYTYNDVPYSAALTIAASKGQAVWQLKPSVSSVVFQRLDDNSLTPESKNVGLTIVKIDGGSTTEYTWRPSGLTVRYSTSAMPSSASDGTLWQGGGMTVPNSAAGLFIALFDSAGKLLDRETISVILDGEKGGDGASVDSIVKYFIATLSKSTPEWNNGTNWKEADPTLTSWSATNRYLWCREKTILTDTTVMWGNIYLHSVWGQNGQSIQGRAGRFYYYAGPWDADTTYQMANTQAPYVKASNGRFYMLDNDEGGGVNINSRDDDPADGFGSGNPWSEMASEQQYYIAKAFFGEYAHFGSFIINGDWMISQHGTINGSYSEEYTKFDPAYPNTSRGGYHTVNGTTWYGWNFVPNFAVDGLTGATYQNNANIRGTVYAEAGNIAGLSITDNTTMYGDGACLYLSGLNASYDWTFKNDGATNLRGLILQDDFHLYSDAESGTQRQKMSYQRPLLLPSANIALPKWPPKGWVFFVKPIGSDVEVSVADTSTMRILRADGSLETTASGKNRSAIFIKIGDLRGYDCWAEWYCG